MSLPLRQIIMDPQSNRLSESEDEKLLNLHIKWVSAHEFGHVLGLRHTFSVHEDLSVMEYVDLFADLGRFLNSEIADEEHIYDNLAIEYGYRPNLTPEQLTEIANRYHLRYVT